MLAEMLAMTTRQGIPFCHGHDTLTRPATHGDDLQDVQSCSATLPRSWHVRACIRGEIC